MSIYVFAGPSISPEEAAPYLDATFLPPVAMGDLVRLMSRRPRAVAIVDGVFETVPSIWHKEILFALSQGVAVYGASSMGALRAAELHSFGMVGVGRIFEQYRDGILEDDDEVAVTHDLAEGGFRQRSEPMVNIRHALQLAQEELILSAASAGRLLEHAKARFYPDRSWVELLSSGKQLGVPDTELAALRKRFPKPPNLKRADAIQLLETMASDLKSGAQPSRVHFDFEPTHYWNTLVAYESACNAPAVASERPIDVSAVGRHVRLNHPERDQLLREALGAYLIYNEAKRCGFAPDSLAGEDTALVGTSRVSPNDPVQMKDLVSRLSGELIALLRSRLDPFVSSELARRGELSGVLSEVTRKLQATQAKGISTTRLAEAGVDIQSLSDWYDARFGQPQCSGDAHAQELGFSSWEEFLSEALIEYLSDSSAQRTNPVSYELRAPLAS